MRENEVKPGTRCECPCWKDSTSAGHRHHYDTTTGRTTPNCQSDAVRLVTVRFHGKRDMGRATWEDEQIPMCAPCAEYHEQKAGAR